MVSSILKGGEIALGDGVWVPKGGNPTDRGRKLYLNYECLYEVTEEIGLNVFWGSSGPSTDAPRRNEFAVHI